jgi:hypothetical protein
MKIYILTLKAKIFICIHISEICVKVIAMNIDAGILCCAQTAQTS